MKGLLKDIEFYQDQKEDHLKEEIANSISTKIKHIIVHGLELKNLLGIIEDQYYNYLIENLEKISKDLSEILEKLKNDRKLIQDTETELGKLVVYDYKLNSERNVNFKEEINEAIKSSTLKEDINNLINNIYEVITNKELSLRSKIEKQDILEDVKKLL